MSVLVNFAILFLQASIHSTRLTEVHIRNEVLIYVGDEDGQLPDI